ncbi:MAG: KpsF/GutQ family sugar-phosphate isomerase [Bacteroidales bacterium]|nr:KpsF/GutQ family sugar-phosphate isomerase [Bacteroidales bacterium]
MNEIKLFFESVLEIEAQAILKIKSINTPIIEKIVDKILKSKGRIIVTGIGKSAIIAQKFVATLNSTGTSAIFLHAADAIHGDLGVILPDDIVFCLSKSGNTPEIKVLVPLIKHAGNCLVAIVGDSSSYLAQHADYIIYTPVEREACPLNLAPTASTTVQLVVCDAIAMTLLKLRGFTAEDFARYHPGGTLGRKLYMRVVDIIEKRDYPQVMPEENIKNVIIEISSKRLGATAVIENNKVVGIITDGDLRRMLEKHDNFLNLKAKDIMTKEPKTIFADEHAVNAFYIMEKHKITQLIVLNEKNEYSGMIHLHDILRAGIV